jgi:hypothetical protein
MTASCKQTRQAILASASGTRATAIQRGFTWLDQKVKYSQKASHAGYRTDCSGFLSMCWSLGTSLTTADFAGTTGGTKHLASYDNLVPGDGFVRRVGGEGHAILFLGWNDTAHSSACVLEQESTALGMQFHTRTTASLKSQSFKPITNAKLTSAPATAPAAQPGDDDDDDATATNPPASTGGGQSGSTGATPAAGGDGTACVSDGACNPGNDGSGMICVGGQCVPGCHSNAQCPGATTCVQGQCE